MAAVLTSLHHIAHKQWSHRNEIKAKVNNPQEKLAVEDLDREITSFLMTKMQELHPEDRHRLNRNLLHLLSKSKASKQQ